MDSLDNASSAHNGQGGMGVDSNLLSFIGPLVTPLQAVTGSQIQVQAPIQHKYSISLPVPTTIPRPTKFRP